MNSVHQDQYAVAVSPPLPPSQLDFQWLSSADSLQSPWCQIRVMPWGATVACVCVWGERWQCGLCVAAFLLLRQSVVCIGICGAGGCFSLMPVFQITLCGGLSLNSF